MKTEELRAAADEWLSRLETEEEKAANTIKSYRRSLDRFIGFAEPRGEGEVTKKTLIDWKAAMSEEAERNRQNPKPGRTQLRAVSSINQRLIAVNKFLRDSGRADLAVGLLRDGDSNTLDDMLTENEYRRILEWADKLGRERTGLIIETLTGTGIRIGELRYITVESLRRRTAVVTNKGKTRTICIPKMLARRLKSYCERRGIAEGIIFHGASKDRMLNQTDIRMDMKRVAGKARGIRRDKVHAHAFRHLFAKRYANMPGANPFILPVLLGHSSKSQGATAIYAKPTTKELLKAVDDLEAYYAPPKTPGKTKGRRGR